MQSPLDTASPERVELPAPVSVVLVPPSPAGRFRWEAETSGLVTLLLETGLADMQYIVPRVAGGAVAPGMAGALVPDDAVWTGTIAVEGNREALDVELTLCDPRALCTAQRASATAARPEPAVAELLGWAAVQMRLPPSAGARERWGDPVSGDEYAVLICGRSAAVWYGLLDGAPDTAIGDVKRDPIARAVYIDPTMDPCQWIVDRRLFAMGDPVGARISATQAAMVRPDRAHLRADEAVGLGDSGRRTAALLAWQELAVVSPGDPRFVVPHAEAAVRAGEPGEARSLIEGMPPRMLEIPRVVRARVAIADALDPGGDRDPLLALWQEADPGDPTPVSRRIALRIHDGRLDEAFDMTDELARRGEPQAAARLAMGLAIGLGRWAQAAASADALGEGEVAARIRARGLLEANPAAPLTLTSTDPVVRIAVGRAKLAGGDPTAALKEADATLAKDRWRPEALALRADALQALGRTVDADKARADLRSADPAFSH